LPVEGIYCKSILHEIALFSSFSHVEQEGELFLLMKSMGKVLHNISKKFATFTEYIVHVFGIQGFLKSLFIFKKK
jgi:hypothetical protein